MFENLCRAYPLKEITSELQLQGAVEAYDKVKKYLESENHIPAHQEQIEAYLEELEHIIFKYQKQEPLH